MARKNTPLDYRVESAIIQVCEDLTLDIDTVAKEICDEFDGSGTPASLSAIVSDLRSARLIQIIENDHDDYVDRMEDEHLDRLYVEAAD